MLGIQCTLVHTFEGFNDFFFFFFGLNKRTCDITNLHPEVGQLRHEVLEHLSVGGGQLRRQHHADKGARHRCQRIGQHEDAGRGQQHRRVWGEGVQPAAHLCETHACVCMMTNGEKWAYVTAAVNTEAALGVLGSCTILIILFFLIQVV